MSGASMNEIKSRMKSVQSTMQITKAMELVATSKLRRARQEAESAKDFCRVLEKAIAPLVAQGGAADESPWFSPVACGADSRVLYIVIAGDRGLAGGYNSNVFKLVRQLEDSENAVFLPIGKKSADYFSRRELEIFSRSCETAADLGVGDCFKAASAICRDFCAGRFCRVELIYTEFVSMLSQVPMTRTLLPLACEGAADEILIDADINETLDAAIPEYIGGMLYYAVAQAVAAESAARRTAMNAANKNAAEMIEDLTLNFNRARQAVITQEITEIVSGAEAL